nr:UDP-N-acetylmuramate--L-alanine ligase [bacterium]
MALDLSQVKHVHMIGIGGISMSGLAEWLLRRGIAVSGSDRAPSHLTDKLAAMGATITIGHRAGASQGADLVVYTAAINRENPELKWAIESGVPCIVRPVLLGHMMAMHPVGIGVSGTHGKTTTTGMLATILLTLGEDPSVHLGGELPLIGGTTREGRGRAFVCEADEYAHSFLQLRPSVAIITNMEFDHPDIFADIGQVRHVFGRFASLLPPDGTLIANGMDQGCVEITKKVSCHTITFGDNPSCAWWAQDIRSDGAGCMHFVLHCPLCPPLAVSLSVPGRHNVFNAIAAMAAASTLGIAPEDSARALLGYTCTKRRFERVGKTPSGAQVILDYAHHPTELHALLDAARGCTDKRIALVFQPHTYSRTKALLADYAREIALADDAYITDIWAAREADTGLVHARDLVLAAGTPHCHYAGSDYAALSGMLKASYGPGDYILVAGAGDIYRLSDQLIAKEEA